jgi:hypothetical protein
VAAQIPHRLQLVLSAGQAIPTSKEAIASLAEYPDMHGRSHPAAYECHLL